MVLSPGFDIRLYVIGFVFSLPTVCFDLLCWGINKTQSSIMKQINSVGKQLFECIGVEFLLFILKKY